MPAVTIRLADKLEKPQYKALLFEYLQELAAFDEVGFDGSYSYFDAYWVEPSRFPYFICVDGNPVGLAMVRELASESYSIAEFYIPSTCRRNKVGQQAAHVLFKRHQGAWYVSQMIRNLPAQQFWRRVIDEFANGEFVETERTEDGEVAQTFSSITKNPLN